MSEFRTFVRCQVKPKLGEQLAGAFKLLKATPRPYAVSIAQTAQMAEYIDAELNKYIVVPSDLPNSTLPLGTLVLIQTAMTNGKPIFHLAETAQAITVGDVAPGNTSDDEIE